MRSCSVHHRRFIVSHATCTLTRVPLAIALCASTDGFAYCPKLVTFALPETLISVGGYGFAGCGCDETIYTAGETRVNCVALSSTPSVAPSTQPSSGPMVEIIMQSIKVDMPASVAGNPVKLQDAAVAAAKAANNAATGEGASAKVEIVTEAKGDIVVEAGTEAEVLAGITAVVCSGITGNGRMMCNTTWATARNRLRSLVATPKT